MEFTERLIVYSPVNVVGADLNVVPAAVQLVGTLYGNLQRGSREAQDAATPLGIYDKQVAIAFFDIGSQSSLGDRYVLKDETGAIWLIRTKPVVRSRWPGTAHVWTLCSNLAIAPTGVA